MIRTIERIGLYLFAATGFVVWLLGSIIGIALIFAKYLAP
jgi:hypothetical protein